MKRFYLGMAVAGFVLTYGLGLAFFWRYGWNIGLFWDWSIGNLAGASVVADATLSTFVFWVFAYREGRRIDMERWWLYVVATFIFGLIAPLGMFLYHREKHLEKIDTKS
jgi:peptidoglycan biosynthesis protein MviN/MurJ (putative lipid II flippase)